MNDDSKLGNPPDLTPEQKKIWDAYYAPRNEAFQKQNLTGKALTEWKYNRFMHDYLGCIKGVDDNVGRLLKYLDDTGLATNTIVIYSSDQGFFLGEHGWFDKRWIFQESARTPLLIRWPGIDQGRQRQQQIWFRNLDLAETFLQAAGLPIPDRMQGRSLMPIFAGRDARRLAHGVLLSLLRISRPTITCARTTASSPTATRWRIFTGRTWIIGNCSTAKKTRSEMNSVFGDPAYADVQTNLMQEVFRQRTELKEPAKDDPKAYGRQPKIPD